MPKMTEGSLTYGEGAVTLRGSLERQVSVGNAFWSI